MGAQPFAIGQGGVIQLFLDGKKFGDEMDVESWDIQHDVDAVSDGVLGEDADRLDHIHKSWSLNLNLKLVIFDKVTAYLKYRQDVDSQSVPDTSVGLKLTPRGNGPQKLFAFSECSIGGMGLSTGGRTNRMSMKLPVKARYLKAI
jgi:hypothetical protein